MEYLHWAWRVRLGQITIYDVPEVIRGTCLKILKKLEQQEAPKF